MKLFTKQSEATTLSIILTVVLAFSQTLTASAYYTENWEIKSFESDIYLNTDGAVNVQEKIIADFTNEGHRGIERGIPYSFEGGRETPIDFQEAKNNQGEDWNTKKFKENGYYYIQMTTGNDSKIFEEATFNLRYKINNVFNFFENRDEFYWNVNGTDWVVPTNSVKTTIHLPEEIEPEKIQLICFTGEYGYKETNCQWLQPDSKTIIFTSTKSFEAYEGLAIAVGLPSGTIAKPTLQQKIWWYLKQNPEILLPITALIIMTILWFLYGRDDQSVSDTVMPYYTPPKGLLPSETGTLIDESVDPKDITAAIIDYAVKGYIRIKESTDYELELIKPFQHEKEFEKKILLGIFNQNKAGQKKKISELKNQFYTHVNTIKEAVIKQLIQDDYFTKSPDDIRMTYYLIGGVVVFISLFIFPVKNIFFYILTGLIIIIFGRIMPYKTKKGTETYYQLKGLYEYINTAEKDRMKFRETEHLRSFEKLLPYAMAFGIVDKWTKAFDGIIKKPPDWYYSSRNLSGHHFNMVYFANQLSSFSSQAVSNITSRPGGKSGGSWGGSAWGGGSGFGGAGFSGGGFGGGGGRGL